MIVIVMHEVKNKAPHKGAVLVDWRQRQIVLKAFKEEGFISMVFHSMALVALLILNYRFGNRVYLL